MDPQSPCAKTVSGTFPPDQFDDLAEAIQNWFEVERVLDRMQQLSRQFIFGNSLDARRHKRLSRRTGEGGAKAPVEGEYAMFMVPMRTVHLSVKVLWLYSRICGQNGTSQGQAGEFVTRGDRWRRELEARRPSPPLACLPLRSGVRLFARC